MGWRGFARAMNRAAVRNQRELQKQQKLIAKMQDTAKAAYEVQVYQNHIDLLLSVHKECGEIYDWAEIEHSEPPAKPEHLTLHEDDAKLNLSSLKIGLSDKLLGRGDAKKKQLLDAVGDAKKLDEKEYQDDCAGVCSMHFCGQRSCASSDFGQCRAHRSADRYVGRIVRPGWPRRR